LEVIPGLVTVACCARNAEDTIGKAITSVLNQDYQNFELYVIDDHSQDQTFEAACDSSQDARLRVLRLSRQIGTDAGKNFVLKRYTRGEFFAHQDADDISWPARFGRQVGFLARHDDVVACGTGIDEFFNQADADLVNTTEIPSPYPIERGSDGFLHRINLYPTFVGPDPGFTSYVIAMNGSLMFRSQVLHAFGGVDGHSLVAAGDTELLLRLIKFHRLANLQEVLYSRRFHRKSVTASPDRGRGSPARQAYRQWLDARHAFLRDLILSGKTEQARQECTQDMYHPEVRVEREWPSYASGVPSNDIPISQVSKTDESDA
jgi:glycosyltransferase involved in cell wall biosynthesis